MGRIVGSVAVFLVGTSTAEAASSPWYELDECRAAYATVLSAELDAAQTAIERLQHSADLGLRTCGTWLEVPLSAMELTLEGKSPALSSRHMHRLEKLFKFAMQYGRRQPELLDLAIEARLRRVRMLVEQGEKTAAIGEARKVEKMLDSRSDSPPNATRMYARGVADLAVSGSPWALRVLVNLAGVGGDGERGERLLEKLAEGKSVYQGEALLVLYQFARQGESSPDADTQRYGAALALAHAESPQYVFDRAVDQYRTGACADALQTLGGVRSRLGANAGLWTPRVRKRVYWLTGRCALDTGDKSLAKESLELASQENHDSYTEEVAVLAADLKG